MRENIEEKKVYEKYIGSPEQIIYDFSLLPGDTFFYNSSYLVLDSITNYVNNPLDCFPEPTPQLSMSNPKVFYFQPNGAYSTIWIEGVGSLVGVLNNISNWGGGLLGVTLLCHFNANQERDYHYVFCDEPAPCKGVIDDIDPVINSSDTNLINIYPNPVINEIIIDFQKKAQSEIIHYNFYSIEGKLLKSVLNDYSNKVDIHSLPKGIYFLEIILDKQQRFTHKFIKQ